MIKQRIESNPDVMMGKPVIKNTRITSIFTERGDEFIGKFVVITSNRVRIRSRFH